GDANVGPRWMRSAGPPSTTDPCHFLRASRDARRMTTARAVAATADAEALLAVEARVCSHGDTVHYAERPKLFARCEGSYLFDTQGTPYLDLQMWYSAVNLGYANARINTALKRQIDQLPQLACQYLHAEKIQLAAALVADAERAFGRPGRI